MKLFRALSVPCIGLVSLTSGCNLYSSLDSPSGDAQLLSAARACMDSGDFECAKKYYQDVSADESNVAASERSFAILSQHGVTMVEFLKLVGDIKSGTGLAITKMAERLAVKYTAEGKAGPNPGRRAEIYGAYKLADQIKNDEPLKGFVQFSAGISLMAEILAESMPAGATELKKDHLVSNAAACKAKSPCATSNDDENKLRDVYSANFELSDCERPSGSVLTSDARNLSETESEMGTNPTLNQLYGAIELAITGLGNTGVGGNFDSAKKTLEEMKKVQPSSTVSFVYLGQTVSFPANKCYRFQLIGDTINLGR